MFREVLQQQGISGEAVGEINLESDEARQGNWGSLYAQFEERLNELRQRYYLGPDSS